MRTAFIFGAALLCAAAARADYAVSRGGALDVNGVHALTIRTGGASSRASAAARTIRNAREGVAVTTRRVRRNYVIKLGSATLLTVTKAEAAAAGSTPAGLAGRWAASLRSALTLPAIKVLTPSLSVPLNGTRLIKVVGSKAHVAQVRTEPGTTVSAARKSNGFEVRGKALGSASVTLVHGDSIGVAEVTVLPLAAHFPQRLNALVSGLPASEEIVRGAIETSLRTTLKTAKNANLKFDMPALWAISAGQARTVNVRVHVEAQGAFATEGLAQVTIRNMGLGYAREEELWYCNNPENLKGPGMLLDGSLAAGKAVRLLYHHINDSPSGLYVQVEAVNASDRPGQLLIIPGDSEPDKNPVRAGIVAGERFLRRWLSASGEVISLPPRSKVPLALRRLGPKDTMSGLCSLWLLEEGPPNITLRVQAQPPQSQEAFLASTVQSEAPWRFVEPQSIVQNIAPAKLPFEYVFPNPFKQQELSYLVGGRHGFVRIGQNAIARADQNGALDGNFGVLYRIEVAAENPTFLARDLEVLFEASAGYSGALFVLNGGVMRTPLLQPKTTARIVRMKLEPGQTKKFDLFTIPLSGSSYPATVILRPVDQGVNVAADLSGQWQTKL